MSMVEAISKKAQSSAMPLYHAAPSTSRATESLAMAGNPANCAKADPSSGTEGSPSGMADEWDFPAETGPHMQSGYYRTLSASALAVLAERVEAFRAFHAKELAKWEDKGKELG